MAIGGRWFAWIGAIIIVLAAGFAVKIGIDNGWWGSMPAGLRFMLIGGWGVAMIAAGEWAYRRIGRAAAVGLLSAGLGVLYLNAYAGHATFALFGQEVAFLLMAGTSFVGFALNWRVKGLAIGVLSLLGGYLTPVLLSSGQANHMVLLTYITLLLGVSLALSAISPRPFRTLRYVAIIMHAMLAASWMAHDADTQWPLALVFSSVWWAMVGAESMFAAARRQSSYGNALITLASTAMFVTAGCAMLQIGTPTTTQLGGGYGLSAWLGLFTAAVAVLSLVGGMHIGNSVECLRARPTNAPAMLGASLWAQGAVLLVVAVALQFDGLGQSAGWLALSVGAIEIGRRIRSRGADVFGLIVLGLSIAVVLLLQGLVTGLYRETIVLELGSFTLSLWGVVMLLCVAATLAASFRLRSDGVAFWRIVAVGLSMTAAALWMLTWAIEAQGITTTWFWLGGAVALLGTHRLTTRHGGMITGATLLGAAAVRWVLVDAFAARLLYERSPGSFEQMTVLLNVPFITALAIAAVALWTARGLNRSSKVLAPDSPPGRARSSTMGGLITVSALLFVLTALSFEIERMLVIHHLADSIAAGFSSTQVTVLVLTAQWAAGALFMMVGGRARRIALMEKAGASLLIVAACAWLVFETVTWRAMYGATAATVVLNVQCMAGLVIGALLLAGSVVNRATSPTDGHESLHRFRREGRLIMLGLVALVGLWAGSLEIDRAFINAPQQLQTGLSVYWGLYAVAMVVLGFWKKLSLVRYAGLALLAITAAKVLFIDLRDVSPFARVISFLVSGLLLVGTSIVYARLAPKLLENDAASDNP